MNTHIHIFINVEIQTYWHPSIHEFIHPLLKPLHFCTDMGTWNISLGILVHKSELCWKQCQAIAGSKHIHSHIQSFQPWRCEVSVPPSKPPCCLPTDMILVNPGSFIMRNRFWFLPYILLFCVDETSSREVLPSYVIVLESGTCFVLFLVLSDFGWSKLLSLDFYDPCCGCGWAYTLEVYITTVLAAPQFYISIKYHY